MPKIAYRDIALRPSSLKLIEHANEIIEEYAAQGFVLTLRQLYYQFVARDLIANTVREYKRLGSVVNDARLVGLIDWEMIEDRTRNLEKSPDWENPQSILNVCAETFQIDKWEGQAFRVEVWIEKEALAGVFDAICRRLQVPFLSCRGYTSQSEMWRASIRLRRYSRGGQRPVILHFGDHDPSGIDMTRDIIDRMALFGCDIKLERLALNMPQVEQFSPPPNPAKTTDSRFEAYMQIHGHESWELDALEPAVLVDLVERSVMALRDEEIWNEKVLEEEEHKRKLSLVRDQWDELDLSNGHE